MSLRRGCSSHGRGLRATDSWLLVGDDVESGGLSFPRRSSDIERHELVHLRNVGLQSGASSRCWDISQRRLSLVFMDLYFDSAYKLYKSHCQRISTEPRVPMFEGFTMPTLTTDSERNAMYKQLQCRPFAISQSRTSGRVGGGTCDRSIFRVLSSTQAGNKQPIAGLPPLRSRSRTWNGLRKFKRQLTKGRLRFAKRQEYPSLWETEELQVAMLEKLECLEAEEEESFVIPSSERQPPRATVCYVLVYLGLGARRQPGEFGPSSAGKAQERGAMWISTCSKDFVKITTAGEGDDVSVDGEEETEEVQLEGAKRPATVFQPIVHRPSAEEQRRLLQLGYQARKNQYTNEFLQETWLQKDVF